MAEILAMHNQCLDYLLKHYPQQTFTLRKINRGNRLSHGYWFHGNDNYMALSFWDAYDWRNKTPSIYLQFEPNGKNILLFIDNDNTEKERFFEKIAPQLGMHKTKRRGNFGNYWVKTLVGDDYLHILKNFIEKEKPLIDTAIQQENVVSFFPPIDKTNFQENLERIKKYRRADETDPITKEDMGMLYKTPLCLKTLHLKNIGHYENISIQLDKQVTCFIGENGSGKSTLLRGLGLALTGINPFIEQAGDKFIQRLLRIKNGEKEKIVYAPAGEITLNYTVGDKNSENTISFKSASYLKQHFVEDVEFAENSFALTGEQENLLNYLCIGFSQQTESSFAVNNTDTKDIVEPNIEDMRALIFNKPDDHFNDIYQWLLKLIDGKTTAQEKADIQILIPKITLLINQLTANDFDIFDNGKEIMVRSTHFPNAIPFNMLSQGYFNVVGWIGYFIKRLWQVTPNDKKADFANTSAICLIDEIDTYLHPKWQIRILDILASTFSNTQFIVTTHSPYVITHLNNNKNSARIYKVTPSDIQEIQASGQDLNTASWTHFGVQRRPLYHQKLIDTVFRDFDNYQENPQSVSIDALKTKIETLTTLLGVNDPDVALANSLFETFEVML